MLRFNPQTDRLRPEDKDHYRSKYSGDWTHWASPILLQVDQAFAHNAGSRVQSLRRITEYMQAVIAGPVESVTPAPETVVIRLQRVLREGITVAEAAGLIGSTTAAVQRHLRRLGWESACPVVNGKVQRNQPGTLRRIAGGKAKIRTGRRSRATKAEMEARRGAEIAVAR